MQIVFDNGMKQATVILRNLSIGYHNGHDVRTVIADISARLFAGEVTCLLGVNGVGKSTLLRTLSGFQSPIAGSVEISGKDIKDYGSHELAQTIGVVLTDKPNVSNMTVEEIVGMGRSPYTGFWGRLSDDDRHIVGESMNMVGVSSLAPRMIQTLSDGERQKVMIAKALAQQTPVIFLDEPTAFLDFPSKVEVMQLLHRISREAGKTIFLSTHDVDLALQTADKLWLLDRDNGLRLGTPEDLSLNGQMASFFAHKGIAFDAENGLFRIDNATQRDIHMDGRHGVSYLMVRKALARNGIHGSRHVDSKDSIEVLDEGYRYRNNATDKQVKTIGELLDLIEGFTPYSY